MPNTPYQTDQERRQLIGKTLSEPFAGNAVITKLNDLATKLYDPDTSPVEDRISKIFIPIELDYSNDATNNMLITQTCSPLYEEITSIISDVLNDEQTQAAPQLLDKRLKPFILNSLFSNRWNSTNMPENVLQAMRPFQDNSLVQSVLKHKIDNLHKDTTALTAKICATQFIRYNIYKFVETYYDQIKYLADTNPAVITLYVYTQDITKPLEHEGEVVKVIRDHLQQRHPDYPLSSYWKAFSKRSHESIYNHITACSQQNMQYDEHTLCTELLIATTITNTHLAPTSNTWLDTMNDNRFNSLAQRKPILMLLLKESQKHATDSDWYQGVGRQINDVSDYVRDMNPDAKVTSTSWNGLLARSDEWHRDQRANYNIRQHDPRTLKCWNSMIEEPVAFEKENIVVIPLVNSMQLYTESDEVQHCVRMYADSCVNGRSRIFKIRPIKGESEREKVGTMEIDLNGNNWSVRQVRGIKNHSMNPVVDKIAMQIAAQYTSAWNALDPKKGDRHTSWTEDRTDNVEEQATMKQYNRDEI